MEIVNGVIILRIHILVDDWTIYVVMNMKGGKEGVNKQYHRNLTYCVIHCQLHAGNFKIVSGSLIGIMMVNK